MGATCSTIQQKYSLHSKPIAVIPAEKEKNLQDDRKKKEIEKERVKAMDRERLNDRINPLQSSSHQDEIVPVEVMLTRMWNSVVCAELVKGEHRCVVEEGTTVQDAVALMKSTKTDYVMVKKAIVRVIAHVHQLSSSNPIENVSKIQMEEDRSSNVRHDTIDEIHHRVRSKEFATLSPGPTPPLPLSYRNTIPKSPTSTIVGPSSGPVGNPIPMYEPSLYEVSAGSPRSKQVRHEKEEYLGIVDWRDLNTLLVRSFRKTSAYDRKKSSQLTEDDLPKPSDRKSVKGSDMEDSDLDSELSDVCVLPTGSKMDDEDADPHSARLQERAPIDKFTNMHDMMRCPVEYVINLSERNPLVTVNKITPLLGGVNLLVGKIGKDTEKAATSNRRPIHTPGTVNSLATHPSPGATGVISPRTSPPSIELYRLPVLNNENYFLGCISQLACAKFIAEKLYSLGNIGNVPLSECSLGTQKIQTINWSANLLSALVRMSSKYLSSLAIIDSSGKLVGTISCSDVKFILEASPIELMNILYMPVSTVVSAIRSSPTFWHINLQSNTATMEKSYNHTLTLNTPLHDAIKMLLTQRVRRMWVVNENNFPIGVMSISDIVKLLLPKNPNRPKTLISRFEKAKV